MAVERQEQRVDPTRREFLKGMLQATIGTGIIVSGLANYELGEAKEQEIASRAKKAVKKDPKYVEVDPYTLWKDEQTVQRLSAVPEYELDIDEKSRLNMAKATLRVQRDFTQAVEERKATIMKREGRSLVRKIIDHVVPPAGGGLAIKGILKIRESQVNAQPKLRIVKPHTSPQE